MNHPSITEDELPPRTRAVWDELVCGDLNNCGIAHRLRDHLAAAHLEIERWETELTRVMPADFKDWHQNSKTEWPQVAAMVIECIQKREKDILSFWCRSNGEKANLAKEIERFKAELEAAKEDRNRIAMETRNPLLAQLDALKIELAAATASRNHAQLLREAADSERDYWKSQRDAMANDHEALELLYDTAIASLGDLKDQRDAWKDSADDLNAFLERVSIKNPKLTRGGLKFFSKYDKLKGNL